MSYQQELNFALMEKRLIRDFMLLEVMKYHEEATLVNEDERRARQLINKTKIMGELARAFRNDINVSILNSLDALSNSIEFLSVDLPTIKAFEHYYAKIEDIVDYYMSLYGLKKPSVPVTPSMLPPYVKGVMKEFNGCPAEWRSFRFSYIDSVHRSYSRDGVRFKCLLSLLLGKALDVVAGFPPCEENYVAAWSTLQYHYEICYAQCLSQLDAIYGSSTVCTDLQFFEQVFKKEITFLRVECGDKLPSFVKCYVTGRQVPPIRSTTETLHSSTNLRMLMIFSRREELKIWERQQSLPPAEDIPSHSYDPTRWTCFGHGHGSRYGGCFGYGGCQGRGYDYGGGGGRNTVDAELVRPAGESLAHVLTSTNTNTFTTYSNNALWSMAVGIAPMIVFRPAFRRDWPPPPPPPSSSSSSSKPLTCLFCCDPRHKLSECDSFRQMCVRKRKRFALKKKLCFLCLSPSHEIKACTSTLYCTICYKRHHKSLHFNKVDKRRSYDQ